MTLIKISRSGESILTPPRLPSYLSAVHDLKRIVGKPKDEDVKAIHAVIRAMSAVAHLPTFYNPGLSMQLSQHLFGAQMAIYQADYSTSLLPGSRSVYTAPTLPSHIPGMLNKVVGTPSDEDIKSAQNAVRTADSLAIHPHLFDADLNTKLSQHLFNLQFARYMHDSAQGSFAPNDETEEPISVPQSTQESQEILGVDLQVPNQESEQLNNARNPTGSCLEAPPELARIGEVMNEIRDEMRNFVGSQDNMNRMLTLIKRDQCAVICHADKSFHILKDPLNQQHVAASERGLPPLNCSYYPSVGYGIYLSPEHIARYLKFFNVGAELLQAGEVPKLIDAKGKEAIKLLLEQACIGQY